MNEEVAASVMIDRSPGAIWELRPFQRCCDAFERRSDAGADAPPDAGADASRSRGDK